MEYYYTIAEHLLKIEGDDANQMEKLLGFVPFKVNEPIQKDNILTIELIAQYKTDFAGEVISTFNLEENKCTFLKNNNIYALLIESPNVGTKPALTIYEANSKICRIYGNKDILFLRFSLWTAFGLLTLPYNTVAIHSSVIDYNNRAYMFLGESGTGKSTHTKLWLNNITGAELLNDDSPFLRVLGNKVYVYGSPWSGKTPCYKQTKRELGALVRLSQAPYNKIKELSVLQAVGALYPSCPPAFNRDRNLQMEISTILNTVISNYKLYHLECLPNIDSCNLSHKIISC